PFAGTVEVLISVIGAHDSRVPPETEGRPETDVDQAEQERRERGVLTARERPRTPLRAVSTSVSGSTRLACVMSSRRQPLIVILGVLLPVFLVLGVWLGGHPEDLPGFARGSAFEQNHQTQVVD